MDKTDKAEGILGSAFFFRYGLSRQLCDGVNLGFYLRGGKSVF